VIGLLLFLLQIGDCFVYSLQLERGLLRVRKLFHALFGNKVSHLFSFLTVFKRRREALQEFSAARGINNNVRAFDVGDLLYFSLAVELDVYHARKADPLHDRGIGERVLANVEQYLLGWAGWRQLKLDALGFGVPAG